MIIPRSVIQNAELNKADDAWKPTSQVIATLPQDEKEKMVCVVILQFML
jgi:hypothetical protein